MENKALVIDLVSWLAGEPRPYSEVMEAWRTSCPRLTIWEDAVDAGLVEHTTHETLGHSVRVTPKGIAFLARENSTRH